MKKVIFSLLIVLVASACSKWKDDTVTYYCEDYKETDMNILNVHSSQIDALWVEMEEDKDKELTIYTLIVKSNGEFHKETGTFQTDWKENITFLPNGNDSYNGTWLYEKEKYTLTYALKTRTEELTFIYKETGCKK